MRKITPIINYDVIKLCRNPYYNHKNGCPNWNKKEGCPPTKILGMVINLNESVFVIFNKFNFKEHVEKMRTKHPSWSKKQLECCLYWQGKARKQLSEKIKIFLELHPNYKVIKCPEATGVDITSTMKSINVILEWPPINYTYQIALAGIPMKSLNNA